MRIAIIGSGISGLTAAYLLSDEHEVTAFEAADYIGGHTNTVDVKRNGSSYASGARPKAAWTAAGEAAAARVPAISSPSRKPKSALRSWCS